jgi:uncharacterized protein (DUF2267 family)
VSTINTEEFVSAVRASAEIETYEKAEVAVKATLTVLGQRLASEAPHLAAQLPTELAEYLHAEDEQVEKFDLAEFYERVARLEGHHVDPAEARRHARAVTAALRASVGDEYIHMLSQLPNEYGDLTHSDKGEYPGDVQVPRGG